MVFFKRRLSSILEILLLYSKNSQKIAMRTNEKKQFHLGDIPISDIEIDIRSRDDIPALLLGLQHVNNDKQALGEIFAILEDECTTETSRTQGRPGMSLWNILVFAVLRLNLNSDYDRIQELANNHIIIRQMLGHGNIFEADFRYGLQTIKDNVNKLSDKTICQINSIVVGCGHDFVGMQEGDILRGRADSFVLETNVDFPTDVKLTLDALRNAIRIIVDLCNFFEFDGWREHKSIVRKIKKLGKKVHGANRAKPKSDKGKQKKEKSVQDAYKKFITNAINCIAKIESTLATFPASDVISAPRIAEIKMFVGFARLQNDQMYRRIFQGEKISNDEKIFSVFEEYTEWINKGKAGVPVELGVKVCILEDQHGFILHHRVMQNEVDSGIAVEFIKDAQKCFPALKMCSFDKGFHSPTNQKELSELLPVLCVLPKKGKRTKDETEREQQPEFVKARHQHSAVESAINALEVHGLDCCPDRGLDRFYNYVALGVLGRNLHLLGCKIRDKARKEAQEKAKKLRRAA